VTKALRQASKGVATVDDEPAQDEWGNFYSAYSPVYDSNGRIAGIVGLDFNSEWYDSQIRENTKSIGILSVLFVVTGEVMVLVITRRMRRRFNSLGEDLSVLSSEMDELMGLISANSNGSEGIKRTGEAGDSDQRVSDELEELGKKIQSMQQEMQHYLSYVHAQANTDALTQVGNTTAYMATKQRLEENFSDPACAFGIAVFDINLLKLVNDRHGHAAGDHIIQGAASAISKAFGPEHTYRIGGDEFVAVVEQITEEDLANRLEQVDQWVDDFNEGQEVLLSLSKGASTYLPVADKSFQDVFARADQTMYEQKEAFHRQLKEPYRRYY
jgi:diguanylate cyclase (GGDEF)-like protein